MSPLGSFRSVLFGGGLGPLEVQDTFDRANGPLIGSTTSDGKASWELVQGTGSQWEVYNNLARYTGSSSDDPITVVDTRTPDVDITLDTGWGGDAIVFRVVDANNWLRVRTYSYSSTSCSTCYNYSYSVSCGQNTHPDCCGGGGPYGCCSASNPSTNCGSCPSCSPSTCCVQGSCSQGGTCSSYSCNCNTYYYYRAYFDKMVNGSVSDVTSYWSGSSSNFTSLRVVASANTVRVYTGGTDRGVFTVEDHKKATLHGIGRAYSARNNESMNNFHATPL